MEVDEMKEKSICALLSGVAKTGERAKHLAESYKSCPYVNFIATKEDELYATYFLPERQKWWSETIEERPRETIGLEKVKITIVESVHYPNQLKM
ncbi:hypothetical protein GTO27_08565 [Candidatus Bathyarchaeota archaeon]|nr:hypothetical protein [Candidatus Bathyarchaeota archaeon]